MAVVTNEMYLSETPSLDVGFRPHSTTKSLSIESLVRNGISHILSDMDFTLIHSRDFWLKVHITACRSCGVSDEDAIKSAHSSAVAQSSTEINVMMENLCRKIATIPDEFSYDDQFRKALGDVLSKLTEEEISNLLIPGSIELLWALRSSGVENIVLVTNSIRQASNVLLRITGLDAIFNKDEDRICCNDEELNGFTKADSEYWRLLREWGIYNPKATLMLEDNADAARWALEHGDVKYVCIRSRAKDYGIQKLEDEYSGRVLWVKDWIELFDGMTCSLKDD